MTLEKVQQNRRIFRAATLVGIAFSPLCMAVSSYAWSSQACYRSRAHEHAAGQLN